jgi:CDP-diacylglycerol--glycerol-3-phosphate 3-phosphatidyltransferase
MSFANKISIFRIIVVPFFIASVLYYDPQRDFLRFVSLGIFLLAVISDAADGYIARLKKEKTRAGTIIDPLADKLLLISAFICLRLVAKSYPAGINFPLWLIIIVISRDVVILLGSAVIYLLQGDLRIVPTKLGKITAALQMICIITLIIQWPLSRFVWYFTILFTVLSGFGYIRRGINILNVNGSKINNRLNS